MKAQITEETSIKCQTMSHDIDMIICDLKQVKTTVNNANQKQLNNFDLDVTKKDMQNLMIIANVLKVKIEKI